MGQRRNKQEFLTTKVIDDSNGRPRDDQRRNSRPLNAVTSVLAVLACRVSAERGCEQDNPPQLEQHEVPDDHLDDKSGR